MEPPDPSFADEFNVPREDTVLVFGVRRAAVSLSFKVHRLNGDLPRQHSFATTLRFTGPVPADSRAVNAIGTQLCDPTNSGLTRWRMAV